MIINPTKNASDEPSQLQIQWETSAVAELGTLVPISE